MSFLDIAKSLLTRGASKTSIKTLQGGFGGQGGVSYNKASRHVKRLKNIHAQNNASLASVSSLSVLDPVGIYDISLKRYENMDPIMQMSLIIIMGYVLRAIPFLADKTRHQVIKVLSQLSPSASISRTYEKIDSLLHEDAYEFGLPTLTAEAKGGKSKNNSNRRAMLTGKATGLMEANDFSVGKSFEVDIPIGNRDSQKVPLTMILQARAADYETLKGIGDGGSPSRSWLERWIKFQAGSKSIGALVTQGDLVTKDIKAAMRDKSGIHAEIMRRKSHGKVAVTFGGEVRYGIGSNLLITSLSTTERLMKDLRFDISDYRQRQKIMGAFSCLLWVVVDKEDDFVINYYRDIRLPSEVPLSAVKRLIKQNKSSDQIVESLRALSANRAPVI